MSQLPEISSDEYLPTEQSSPLVPLRSSQDFLETVMQVNNIVQNRLYKGEKNTSLESYFRKEWNMSRAQVYRYLDCAFVIHALQGFTQLPNRERLCRSMKKFAKTKEALRTLWTAVLHKVSPNFDSITSTVIEKTWKELIETGMVFCQETDFKVGRKRSSAVKLTSRGRKMKPAIVTVPSPSEWSMRAAGSDEGFNEWAKTYYGNQQAAQVPLTPERPFHQDQLVMSSSQKTPTLFQQAESLSSEQIRRQSLNAHEMLSQSNLLHHRFIDSERVEWQASPLIQVKQLPVVNEEAITASALLHLHSSSPIHSEEEQ